MSADLDVVTLGEAMLMLVAGEAGPLEGVQTFHKRTAGAETNVAIGLSRLGLKVGWASRLGDDSMARYLLDAMRREGVDCSRVACEPGERTGFQFKGRVDDGSDPPVEYHRRGSAASRMTPGHLDDKWLLRSRHLHVTGVFPALAEGTRAATRQAIATMRAAGRTISFDPNLRPTLWATPELMRDTLNDLAQQSDWVLPGIEEGRFLTGHAEPERIAAFYRARGASLVVVKLGADGAYFDGEAGTGHVEAYSVERVVDTVGAGDGFAVGVISALLEGRPVSDAVRRGAWIGARAVQVRGDTEGLPTHAQLAAASL
ncbi:sugar kinase [Cupriavidus oxalaticus]|jgi:2-dehydro-3-deoxygluconokinase|uniref:Sugar kinase n=1 Tax=Cupriavidus oxalaticus TaxID=96344 RepID=A0A5P3VA99_9BURK|nr:sugar kinase [Cupriavidus oxalaticus]QEZ43210.1 sugar kinase [Cupriavidus oxalaticus]